MNSPVLSIHIDVSSVSLAAIADKFQNFCNNIGLGLDAIPHGT